MTNKKILNLTYILLLGIITYIIILLKEAIITLFSKTLFILFPFFISIILVILLNNRINKIQKVVKYRLLSILIVLSIITIIIFMTIKFLSPLLVGQINSIIKAVPNLIMKIEDLIEEVNNSNDLISIDIDYIFEYLKSKSNEFEKTISSLVSNVFKYLKQIIFIPVIVVIVLFDYDNIKSKFLNVFSDENKYLNKKLLNMIYEIKECSYEFMKTYILITVVMSFISSFIFYFLGLNNYIILGIVIGLTNIIPIIGPFIGGAICTIYALTINVNLALCVFAIIFIIQLIESNIITPYLQARFSNNHTLEVVFSLVLFGELFGVIGMVFSSLILSIIKIVFKYYKEDVKVMIRKIK